LLCNYYQIFIKIFDITDPTNIEEIIQINEQKIKEIKYIGFIYDNKELDSNLPTILISFLDNIKIYQLNFTHRTIRSSNPIFVRCSRRRELGDRLGALRHCMLGQLAGEDQPDSCLDLP